MHSGVDTNLNKPKKTSKKSAPITSASPDKGSLQAAIEAHQTGDLDRAERLYREALTSDPKNADALNNLGIIARRRSLMSALAVQTSRST